MVGSEYRVMVEGWLDSRETRLDPRNGCPVPDSVAIILLRLSINVFPTLLELSHALSTSHNTN